MPLLPMLINLMHYFLTVAYILKIFFIYFLLHKSRLYEILWLRFGPAPSKAGVPNPVPGDLPSFRVQFQP